MRKILEKYKPRKYQREAKEFLLSRAEAGLFLDMGLGKTVVVLSALEDLSWDWEQVLIVAPLYPAVDTWPGELEKWEHLQELAGDYEVIAGKPKAVREAGVKAGKRITIINQENIEWLVRFCGKSWPFDTVILDELTGFKSSRAKRWKALKKVRPYITRIWGLTGTPVANGYEDLWAQLYLLDEGKRLGRTLTSYRLEYFTPGRRNGNVIYEWLLKPFADEEITTKIKDICLSMKSKDWLDLPDLLTLEKKVTLSDKSFKLYKQMERERLLEIRGEEIDAVNAAALMIKLQQLSSGAVYTEDGSSVIIHDEKIEAFRSVVQEAEGENLLVFYQYKHELDRLLKAFPEAVSIKEPGAIERWKAGKIKMLLAHPASAGHGLNLQSGGSALIWYGLPTSYEQYEQSIKRLHRSGQKAETVKNIVLMAGGTYDETIYYRILKDKKKVHEALVEALKKEGSYED